MRYDLQVTHALPAIVFAMRYHISAATLCEGVPTFCRRVMDGHSPDGISYYLLGFQVIIFLRGLYSKGLYRLLAGPFVVVHFGGLLPTLHSCLSLLFGGLV
jgi:hypothetical protein